MLLGVYYVDELRKSVGYPNGKHFTRSIAKLRCDGCGVEFERSEGSSRGECHFCSRECSNRSNSDVRAQTNVVRYGFPCPMTQAYVKEMANSPDRCAKRHETMKRNGTYRSSKAEETCYEALCELFGVNDVERQVIVPEKRWLIDFCVKSIDTYVQFDGEYWHGLDRPIEVIAEHRTPRDVQIHKKWMTDREQDEWFRTRGMKLVRVTDRQLSLLTT
jgi:hypothetical protein